MRLPRRVMRVLFLVGGLVACAGTGSAQAEGGTWFFEGGQLAFGLSPAVAGSLDGASGSLLTEIAKTKVKFLCTSLTVVNVSLRLGGEIWSGGDVKFSGCKTYLNDLESPPCEPFKGSSTGVILTLKLKGLLALHTGGATLFIVEPEVAGKPLVDILMSEECAIGEEVPIFGKLYLKDSLISTELITHLVSESSLTRMFAISDTPEHAATIDGAAKVFLSGSFGHLGARWSAVAD